MKTSLKLRGQILAATRGEVPLFDCFECDGGVYVSMEHNARPTCLACGARCPDSVWAEMQKAVLVPTIFAA